MRNFDYKNDITNILYLRTSLTSFIYGTAPWLPVHVTELTHVISEEVTSNEWSKWPLHSEETVQILPPTNMLISMLS